MIRSSGSLSVAALLASFWSCSPQGGSEASPLDALARGLDWLEAHQSPDGGWHSEQYAVLEPGYSLTAIVLYSVSLLPIELKTDYEDPVARAFGFLESGTDAEGGVGLGGGLVDYPGYTSALYLQALVSLAPPGWQEKARAQVARLRRTQLVESRGWEPRDVQYGGFSADGGTDRKPSGADLLNLSVTTAVLAALRSAGVPREDELFSKALTFVERCQRIDSDGGFFFTTHPDFHRSKAGFERQEDGTELPRSYGSMTFDGIRALLACGLPLSDPRVRAARSWVEDNFTIEETPGFSVEQRAQEKALRMYYYASAAATLDLLDPDGDWREQLAEKVVDLQRADGSWVGLSDLMKEDDPMVATPLAMIALSRALR